jgi:dTDP-4-dehydrorhamnose 3,5-epimerase
LLIFAETKLKGAYIIELERLEDERGFFARTFGHEEFAAHGLRTRFVQCSISFSQKKGTLRGMHYQVAPYEEAKLVRCTMGAIYDVIIDLRPGSPTFMQWLAAELTAQNRKMLYVPEGLAHGFQCLEDETEVSYQMSEFHHPDYAGGVRSDDPAFGIEWPIPGKIIADRDRTYPDFGVQVWKRDYEG